MKVIHVLNNFLPYQIAGTEIYVAALARELNLKNVESVIVVPNNVNANDEYYFEGLRVIKYAESSLADRDLISGFKAPSGLSNFIEIIKNENPGIVHFHELSGSIGIGIFHVRSVKNLGYKIILTFHQSKYSCRTGTLMYMNNYKCDGIIQNLKCSKCWLNNLGKEGVYAALLNSCFIFTNYFNIDTRFLKNKVGTVLAFPRIINDLKTELLELNSLANQIIVLTNWYSKILIKNGIEKSNLTIIEQGLPNPILKIHKKNIPSNILRLIYVGRISHFKGVDILIKSVKQIPTDKIILDIYGSSTEDDYYKKCIALIDGVGNINLKGSIAPDLVISTMKNYDIACIPSMVSEMGPFVLKEAFSAGIPALASDVYGNSEQIEQDLNGWLFKFKNIDSLTFHLTRLVNNPNLIEAAKKNIKPVNSFESVANNHINVYKSILTN